MAPTIYKPSAKPLSGRYLSLGEREEIALMRVQGYSMQAIARRLGRAASTISRELRRNAATRSGDFQYRATTAQWHAERSARRPKPGKLAGNQALRDYVHERLAGLVTTPDAEPPSQDRALHGTDVDMDGGKSDDGRGPGVLNRSHGVCRSTSRMTRPCASVTRPSISRCSSKGAALCGAN
jgi:hypothetical protein